MKTISLHKFGEKYQKNMNEAPLIITKGGKKSFIILPYSMADKVFTNIGYDIAHEVPNRSAMPVSYELTDKPSFSKRIRKLLLTKLF